ncbi:hypothetical protein LHFGNBLO_005323 [Mesorhizobium sp. AR10]|uniref:hypothetical protein n=1 Tax=Mesorhizobium sp. AR10 TaxID=2865839 RepID=UPI00215ECA1C|nr:hypothetical protein [Mesorhizobium sp. AR10]UVK38186.1 hypothetical protein LHFGNBLO_005323 [Mesorhizobium sp. AR10]
MKLISTARLPPPLVLALLVVGGCSSIGRAVDPAKYDTMTCVELNNAVGDVARGISQTAISRGKVANTSVPSWLWGGTRVKTAVADRETARIDRFKQQQEALVAARRRKCAALPG